MTHPPKLRFAVAAFDSWPTVQEVVRDLGAGAKSLQDISYLGPLRVLTGADRTFVQALEGLAFPSNREVIGCTGGSLAERLSGRLQDGARTLQAALGRWLIARHAAHLADAIDHGRITVWVRLLDDDDERRAYRTLLARSSNSVGVHDLVGR